MKMCRTFSSCQSARVLTFTSVMVICFMLVPMLQVRQCKTVDVCPEWPLLIVGPLHALYDLWTTYPFENNGNDNLHSESSATSRYFLCVADALVCLCDL